MTRDWKRDGSRTVAVLGAITAAGLVAVGPAQADPKVTDVQQRVDRLYHQAERAQERYNDAALKLEDLSSELKSLKSDQKRQDKRLSSVREQVQESIVRQYQGEGVNTVGQVVVSDDPSSFLGQLSTMQAFSALQAELFDDYTSEVEALDLRRDATTERRAEVRRTTRTLKVQKVEVEKKLDEAKKVLDRLQGRERARLSAPSRDQVRLPDVKVSGRAADAVKFALAQVGDRYVHGGAGPDAYDCSGLTMAAWAQAGVSLPHSSSAQYAGGRKVARGDLQPGDLVFYYSPISHVGIYIGNGQIVDAANPRLGVRVAGVFSMPFAGAVRPG